MINYPGNFQVSTPIYEGYTVSLSWDSVSDATEYQIERAYGQFPSEWEEIYLNQDLSHVDRIDYGQDYVTYRIRSLRKDDEKTWDEYDALDYTWNEIDNLDEPWETEYDEISEWYVENTIAVLMNRAPIISGQDENIGGKYSNFSVTFSAYDEDPENTIDITATVDVKTVFFQEDIVQNQDYTIDFTISDFSVDQSYEIVITAVDDRGLSSSRVYTFTARNNAPIISGQDEDLGDQYTSFELSYFVNDSDSDDTVDVVIKSNDSVISSIENIEQGKQHSVNIDIYNYDLHIKNTITITATDNRGGESVRQYSFTAKNHEPVISGYDEDLGEKYDNFNISFSAYDEDGDSVNVEVYYKDSVIESWKDISQGTLYDIPIYLNDFSYEEVNQISIIATDARGGKATRVYTFTAVNRPPIISGQDGDLGIIRNTHVLSFSVIDPDPNNVVSASINIDGSQVIDYGEIVQSQEYEYIIDADDYPYQSDHEITILAIDNREASAVRKYLFSAYPNQPPVISGQNEDLGYKYDAFDISFSVTDPDPDSIVDVSIYVNGNLVQSYSDITLDQEYVYSLNIHEYDAGKQNTITIVATDEKGNSDARIYTYISPTENVYNSTYYIFVDGIPKYKVHGEFSLTDYLHAGCHTYFVQGIFDEIIHDSNTITLCTELDYATISSADTPESHLVLYLKKDQFPQVSSDFSFTYQENRYLNSYKPTFNTNDNQSRTVTISFTIKTEPEYNQLTEIVYRNYPVLYRDMFDNRIIGILDAVPIEYLKKTNGNDYNFVVDFSFTITEVDYLEEIEYD